MIFRNIRSFLNVAGLKQLPVVEMPHSTVVQKRLPKNATWQQVTVNRVPLQFRGTKLAHAVVKADFLERTNLLMPGIGFLLQSELVVDWNSRDFCQRRGGPSILSDFVRTSIAGRIGQGLAILFAESKGYSFYGHLREVLIKKGITVTDPNNNNRQLPIADFLVETDQGTRAIIESKGSFDSQANDPSKTKSTFKQALERQVDPWQRRLNPLVQKSFVVASYVRDHSHRNAVHSLLAFVDPEIDSPRGEIQLQNDEVRRENYAAWLSVMGFMDAAQRLRINSSENTKMESFALFELSGNVVAFPIGCLGSPWRMQYISERLKMKDYSLLACGLELNILEALSRSISSTDSTDLLRIKVLKRLSESREDYGFSFFSDGSFFGGIPRNSRLIDIIEVAL